MFKKIEEYFKNSPEISKFLFFVIGAICVIFFTNNFMGVFAPFIIAYIIAMMSKPFMKFLTNKVKLPRIISTIFCLLLFAVVGGIIIWFLIHQVVNGITYIIDLISDKFTTETILSFVSSLESDLETFSDKFNIEIDIVTISNEIYNIIKGLVKSLSNISINIMMGIPSFLVAFIIGCVASFYMVYDYNKISEFMNKQFSEKTKKIVNVFNTNVLFSIFKMLVSYTMLSVICFVELAIGFFILGIRDAWFIAFIIAIIDVFPIIGSGGILVPWGIVLILSKSIVPGIGLIVLWCIIVVVRQVLEPKIVGSQIGLHPLITIMAMFIGLQTMGGLGLLMGPMYVIVCKKLNEAGIISLYS